MTESSRDRFERIKSEVLQLTKVQQASLIKMLSPSQDALDADPTFMGTRVYSSIDLVLKELTGTGAPPITLMAKRMGPTLNRSLGAVVAFTNALGIKFTSPQREATHLFLVRLVASRAQADKGLPLTFTTLIQQLEQVGLYVNQAYPGYVASGNFAIVLASAKII